MKGGIDCLNPLAKLRSDVFGTISLPMSSAGACLSSRCLRFVVVVSAAVFTVCAQKAPPTSAKPWEASPAQVLSKSVLNRPSEELRLAPDRTYTLPELIDLAEAHNPETKAAWQAAKQQAGLLR